MSLQHLKVAAVRQEVNEVISIIFEPVEGLTYKAGQFLTLSFTLNRKELRRSYSFYSSPVVDEPLAIAVKLVENGEISRFLHHQIAAGDIARRVGLSLHSETKRQKAVYANAFLALSALVNLCL